MKLIIATVVAAALSSCATAAQAKMYYFKDFSPNFLVQPEVKTKTDRDGDHLGVEALHPLREES